MTGSRKHLVAGIDRTAYVLCGIYAVCHHLPFLGVRAGAASTLAVGNLHHMCVCVCVCRPPLFFECPNQPAPSEDDGWPPRAFVWQ